MLVEALFPTKRKKLNKNKAIDKMTIGYLSIMLLLQTT